MMVAGTIGMIAAAAALTILALELGQDYIERKFLAIRKHGPITDTAPTW